MSKLNLDYEPKPVFDYKEYLEFMESKKVRHGEDRTYTLLDFVTDEQNREDNEKGIKNISHYDPTPKNIQEHFDFVHKVFNELYKKYPDDKYLYSLINEEEKQAERCSTDWYKKYGIEK